MTFIEREKGRFLAALGDEMRKGFRKQTELLEWPYGTFYYIQFLNFRCLHEVMRCCMPSGASVLPHIVATLFLCNGRNVTFFLAVCFLV